MSATPQHVQQLIDEAVADLEQVTGRYNPNGKWWKPALAALAAARAEAGMLVAPEPPPPPPPPPPSGQPLGIYLDPMASSVNYSTEWDAAKAAIPNLDFAMAPLDANFIRHVGTPAQWCLIPAGMTQTSFIQWGVPCWNTGLVEGFVVVDEPGSDPASVALIKSVVGYVKANCPSAKTAVTQFDPGTLTALANDRLVDVLINDCYPMRSGMTTWQACNAACETALAAGQISEFWIVLDAFQAPNYPAPTATQLLDQIAKSQATHAKRLVVYAWGQAGGTPLAQLPGLVAALNTIP